MASRWASGNWVRAAVVGYNPSGSQPFLVFNPWGTNSSGWALSDNNGQQVYGQFNASAAFLSQNFAAQTTGVGIETGTVGHTSGSHNVPLTTDGLIAARANFPQTGLAMLPSSSRALWDAIWAEAKDPGFTSLGLTSLGEAWFATGLGTK